MDLKQFRYGEGNLAYLVYDNGEAAAIDGGAVDEIVEHLNRYDLTLRFVLNTHDHADHTPGNKPLLKGTSAQFISTKDLSSQGTLRIGTADMSITPTPGHTMDSIVFSCDDWLITGDTLFNGTVGNCYSGDYETYFQSLETLVGKPRQTRIFAGHDLVDYAVGVAENIDPDNPFLADYRNGYDPGFVVTILDMELRVNPFIRFNDPTLDSFRKNLNQPLNTPYERWRAMMTVH